MVKILGKLKRIPTHPPNYKPKRFILVSENISGKPNQTTHLKYGKLTKSEARQLCAQLNAKKTGRLYRYK